MADVEIKGKISVDTGNAGKSINELNTAIKEQSKLLKDAKVGSEEYKSAQAALSKAQDELKKTTDAANETHGKSGEAFGILKDKINGMVPGLEGAQTGVKSFGAELKVLLVNPIILFLTAIVAVLALVYKAFTNTFEGGEKMEQIFAGIKAAAQALIDNLQKLGKVAMDFLTLHWGDAAKGLKDVAVAAGGAFDAMAKLTAKSQELEREQAANDLDHANRVVKLAKLREQQAESLDPKVRRAAALALKKDAEEDAVKDVKLAKDVAENKIAMLTLEEDGARKNSVAISKIRTAQTLNAADSANELRRISKTLTATEKQEIAERKAAEKEAQDARDKGSEKAKQAKAELEKLQDATFKASLNKQDLAILLLEQRYSKEYEILKKSKADTLLLEKNFRRDLTAVIASSLKNEEVVVTKAVGMHIIADNTVRDSALQKDWDIAAADAIKADIDKKLLKIKIAGVISEVEAYGEAAGAVAEIIGKQTKAGKILASASAIIHTLQGIAAGIKLGYPAAIPAIALAAAVGYKTVKAINAVQIPGFSGGSAPTIPSIVTAPLVPTATSTSLNQSSINAVGNAAQGGVNRAFVLDADIRNNHERANRINRAARLG